MAPPSRHIDGVYQWTAGRGLEMPLADWPFGPAVIASEEGGGSHSVPPDDYLAEGQRNDALASMAGVMRRAGLSSAGIEQALLVENVARCVPPLPEAEVRRIARSIAQYRPKRDGKSVSERLGALAMLPWAMLPVVALRHRALGVTPAEFGVLLALLSHYHVAGTWTSMGQEYLASQLAVDRRTIGALLRQLRKKGLIAVRPDPRYGRVTGDSARKATLHYCAEPYLVLLGLSAANDLAESDMTETLRNAARERLAAFIRQVDAGMWSWEVGEISSDTGHPGRAIASALLVETDDAQRPSMNRWPFLDSQSETKTLLNVQAEATNGSELDPVVPSLLERSMCGQHLYSTNSPAGRNA